MSEPVPVILPPLDPTPSGGFLVLFSPGQWAWITRALRASYLAQDAILVALGPVVTSLEGLMATVAELEQKLDAIDAALTGEDGVFENLAGDLTGLKAEIQALKDQIAAGTPVSQEQLDSLVTKADGIATKASANAQKLADLAASTPDAPTP